MNYSNKENTIIQDGNRSIPTDPNNTDYAEILASGVTIDGYVLPEKSWAEIRGERDALLRSSDWMAMADRTITITDAQVSYRQALRDIPADHDDPASVVWPTPPPS
jgi:hypothetical protein